MGFVDMNIPDNVLPLLISFEAKSMFGKLPHAKEILAKRFVLLHRFLYSSS
jgi:hypothetical protein